MKTNRFFTVLFALSSLLLFNQCSKEKTFDCVKSTGTIKKENRYFENFSSLYVEDNINVILMQNMPGQIVIEAGENLLPKIKCEQENDRLTVRNNNTCNWVRSYDKPINVYVGVDQVKEITQKGYGSIKEGEYLKTDTLGFTSIAFGEINVRVEANFIGFFVDHNTTLVLKGKAGKLAGIANNNSLVNTEEMQVQWAYYINGSVLDAKIYSDSLVQAVIEGDGNIICKGKPVFVSYIHKSGKGVLITP